MFCVKIITMIVVVSSLFGFWELEELLNNGAFDSVFVVSFVMVQMLLNIWFFLMFL